MTKPLKIGFDLDGVLLYNPARMFRPITIFAKKLLGRKSSNKTHFYYPHSPIEKLLWRVVHWSSLYIAPGFDDIIRLSEAGLIEPYIITSRYDCLKGDFESWLKRMNAQKYFKGTFHNKNNVQPHVFKEQVVNNLNLHYFVEDNFDIVSHLTKTTTAKTIWITNPFDTHIVYEPKFMTLKKAMDHIRDMLN